MMQNAKVRPLLLVGLLCLISTGAVHAVVRTVDDDPGADFNKVQAAIIASTSGDVVQVSCGIYPENIVMKDGVDVLGAGAGCTTLDGGYSGTVVTFDAVGPGTELSGFTIQHGLSFQGGGIFLSGSSQPTISRNIIRDNRAVLNGSGYFGYGGGISVYDSAPTISNNLLVGNSAERTGGGLDMYFGSAEVVNNTIVGNESVRPGVLVGFGGGIYALFSSPTLTSNIIHDNLSEGGGGGVDLVNSSYMVTFNNLSQNTPANWACSVSSSPCANAAFPPPPGNVSMDPLLEGVGAEAVRFCPRGNSPILDQGPAIPPSEPLDFFGRLRVLDGDLDGTATVDLGYCETDEGSSLLVHSSGLVTWDASVNMLARYNLYRGDLDVLLSSCATGAPTPRISPWWPRHGGSAMWCHRVSPIRRSRSSTRASSTW